MPELIEIEIYRRLADAALGRRIASVVADDAWYLKNGKTSEDLQEALVGGQFRATRRIGKLLLMDLLDGGSLGLRFGMTGTLLVDESPGVDKLMYSSHRVLPEWDRFAIAFDDGGTLRINDPRRLGGVELDPDESKMGVDALTLTVPVLRKLLVSSEVALKARLMDQSRMAGVGNLIADEALWRAGLDPARPARSLDDKEVRRLHKHLAVTLDLLLTRGGSHSGDLMDQRRAGGVCPKDGTTLTRRRVGGRTTYSCPHHQR